MEFSLNDMLTVDDVLADVVRDCADEDYRKRTKGWYVAQIKHALQELEFDTQFNPQFYDDVIPSTMRVNLPEGSFGVRGIYVYSGVFAESTAKKVYRKLGGFSNGAGDGMAANNMQGNSDEFVTHQGSDSVDFYYVVNNGIIILSDACSSYSKVRIVYNGFTKSVMNVAIIPPMVRSAVAGFATVNFFSSMMGEDPRMYAPIYDRKYAALYNPPPRQLSVWDNAKKRISRISPDTMRTIKLYWGQPPI
jgi:hypothetical protein